MRALLLDLDDTLVDDQGAMGAGLAAFYAAHGLDAGDPLVAVTWRAASLRHWERFARGETTFQGQRRDRVRDILRREFSDGEADAAFQPFLDAYEAACACFPEVPEFLRRTEGIPRIIVTNGERPQQARKLARAGLAPHVSALVTPTDCGLRKPDPGIFLAALAGAPASECAMLGDDELRDIEPARRLGMKVFRVDRERTLLQALDYLGL